MKTEGYFTLVSNSNYSIDNNKYYIKNGLCYVFLNVNVISQTGNWATSASGLPKPYVQFSDHITEFSSSTSKASLQLIVDGAGNLKFAFGTTGGTYVYTLSYPIA